MRVTRPTINLTENVHAVVADLCTRLEEFSHIDPNRLLVCMSRTRNASPGGTYAKIVPMRFQDGTPFKRAKGRLYSLPQIPTGDGDVLYLIYLYVPRFFAHPFERRLLVLIHELYHIAPAFDGTIRMFGSKAHGNSRVQFNDGLQPLVQRYLAASPPAELLSVLQSDFTALTRQAHVVGRALPLPKLVQLPG